MSKHHDIDHKVARALEKRDRHAAAERRLADIETSLGGVWQAIEAFCGRIEWGICPVTLKAPQVANSLTSLRNVSGTVRIGQRFVVAIGGSNGPELHEVTEVDSEGRIVATNVIQGSAVFVVQKTHQIRSSGGI